jgi:hypothetical protein
MSLSVDLHDNDAPLFAGNAADGHHREAGRGGGGASTTMQNSDAVSHGALDGRGSDQVDVDDQWKIIHAFFKQNGVVNQQI